MMRKILTACLLLIAIGSQAQQPKDLNFTPARKLQIAEFAIQQLYVDTVNENKLVESAIIEMLRPARPALHLRQRGRGEKNSMNRFKGTSKESAYNST